MVGFRRIPRLALAAVVSLAVLVGPAPVGRGEERLRSVAEQDGVWVWEGDQRVLFYQRTTKSQAGKYPRANYVHPLYDLDGNVLTEDFPGDHPHHRGVFWAWHQVTVGGRPAGDPWVAKDFQWDVEQLTTTTEGEALSLRARVVWRSPLHRDAQENLVPLAEERVLIRVHPRQAAHRAIDFEIQLRALVDQLRIGGSADAKGYGGFSPRLRLPTDVQFFGTRGEVTPQVTSVSAGPWLDVVGTFSPQSAEQQPRRDGVAILCHPSLPEFPPPWILRRSRSMQNAVYPGREPRPVSRQQPTVLRYRLVLHRGPVEASALAQWQAEFAREPCADTAAP